MSTALLETHVRLKRGIQVTQTDWEPFICMQVTGEAARVEQRESFSAEVGEGRTSLEKDRSQRRGIKRVT